MNKVEIISGFYFLAEPGFSVKLIAFYAPNRL